MITIRGLIRTLLFFFSLVTLAWAQEPEILYLSWKGDPATTMTVLWQSEVGNGPTTVFYKLPEENQWKSSEGTVEQIDRTNVTVHHVELTDLKPDSTYLFRFDGEPIHQFKTMPDGLTRPLNIVIGGDAYFSRELNSKMNREVASRDPDFVILAGDVAYTEGLRVALRSRAWKINRWQEFFKMWSDQMVTKEGRLIPIMPVIGNHDVREGFDNPQKMGVLFYQFFVFKEKGVPFRTMKIGNDLIFYLLDSGHTFPVAGRQCEWLEQELVAGQEAKYRIPVYHIPAYPSETKHTHRSSMDIRKHWVPLFEKYGVKASMEHDCHTFKRTFPLKNGMVDLNGVYYLGDGAWGVFPDKPLRRWYLAKALQINNYWQLHVDPEKIDYTARDNEGNKIDQLRLSAP